MYTITIERWKHNGNFGSYCGNWPEERKITCGTLKECMTMVNAARLENDLSVFYPWQISNVEEETA